MSKWPTAQWTNEGALGEGGQGWTHLVRRSDGTDQKQYVLKRLKNKERLARFEKEVEVLSKLSHPGILRVIETGLSDESPFFITEHCERGDLSKADLSDKSLLQKLELYRQVCDAVSVAHDANIIHRDLKPQNILIRNDLSVVVGDFGLCLELDDVLERITATSEAVGARHYIAPELEDGRIAEPKPSSDVYSLGKLLYYIISARSFAREQFRGSPNDLRTHDCDLGMYFVYDLFDRTIQLEPQARYQNARELLEAVDGVIMKIEQKAHVLNIHVPQHCLYCLVGRYQPITGTDSPHELRMKCMSCGNVQFFAGVGRPWWLT